MSCIVTGLKNRRSNYSNRGKKNELKIINAEQIKIELMRIHCFDKQ